MSSLKAPRCQVLQGNSPESFTSPPAWWIIGLPGQQECQPGEVPDSVAWSLPLALIQEVPLSANAFSQVCTGGFLLWYKKGAR